MLMAEQMSLLDSGERIRRAGRSKFKLEVQRFGGCRGVAVAG